MSRRKPRQFKWTEQRQIAVLALAEGLTIKEAAKRAGVQTRTVDRWKADPAFAIELDRLILITDIASRAHRILIAKQVINQKMTEEGIVLTEKDALDWLKYVQSETDGIKLNIVTQFLAAISKDDPSDPGS